MNAPADMAADGLIGITRVELSSARAGGAVRVDQCVDCRVELSSLVAWVVSAKVQVGSKLWFCILARLGEAGVRSKVPTPFRGLDLGPDPLLSLVRRGNVAGLPRFRVLDLGHWWGARWRNGVGLTRRPVVMGVQRG